MCGTDGKTHLFVHFRRLLIPSVRSTPEVYPMCGVTLIGASIKYTAALNCISSVNGMKMNAGIVGNGCYSTVSIDSAANVVAEHCGSIYLQQSPHRKTVWVFFSRIGGIRVIQDTNVPFVRNCVVGTTIQNELLSCVRLATATTICSCYHSQAFQVLFR